MALPGKGFLAIWNDIDPPLEAEWLRWHTQEHMPERVGVPGFLGGRRYADPSRQHHRYFTLYLGETVGTFSSPPYVERLNNPTPWTTTLAPSFRNFLRGACQVTASTGDPVGGAIATIQVALSKPAQFIDAKAAVALAATLADADGLLAAHIGFSDTAISGVQTKEKSLRGDVAGPIFEGVVLVEGFSRSVLQVALPGLVDRIKASALGLAPGATGNYDLSLHLAKK